MQSVDQGHAGLAAAQMLEQVAADLTNAGTEHGRLVAGGIRAYLAAPERLTLDQALNLVVAPGGTPWYRAQAHAERDRLLRQLATSFEAGNTTARVTELRRRLDRYAATSWLIDRTSKRPTAQNTLLFRIFSADERPPMGRSRLREIIESIDFG